MERTAQRVETACSGEANIVEWSKKTEKERGGWDGNTKGYFNSPLSGGTERRKSNAVALQLFSRPWGERGGEAKQREARTTSGKEMERRFSRERERERGMGRKGDSSQVKLGE